MKGAFLALFIIILLSIIQNSSESKVFDSDSFYKSSEKKEHIFKSKITSVKELNVAGVIHYYIFTEKGILKVSSEKYLLNGADKKAFDEFKKFKDKNCEFKVRNYPVEGWKLVDVLNCK